MNQTVRQYAHHQKRKKYFETMLIVPHLTYSFILEGLGAGGLVGAVGRVKERKRRSVGLEEKEKHRPKNLTRAKI
jgi:hypothetical protein